MSSGGGHPPGPPGHPLPGGQEIIHFSGEDEVEEEHDHQDMADGVELGVGGGPESDTESTTSSVVAGSPPRDHQVERDAADPGVMIGAAAPRPRGMILAETTFPPEAEFLHPLSFSRMGTTSMGLGTSATTTNEYEEEVLRLVGEAKTLEKIVTENRKLEDELLWLCISSLENETKAAALEASRNRVTADYSKKLLRMERALGKLSYENKGLKTEIVIAQQHVYD
eukprot:g5590.t1